MALFSVILNGTTVYAVKHALNSITLTCTFDQSVSNSMN